MTSSQIWVLIIGGMAITYSIRALFIIVIPPERMPELVRTGLQFVPPAVLAAMIFPEVLLEEGHLFLAFTNFRFVAAVVASLTAWRTKNTWLTIGLGMIVLWGLEVWLT